MPKFTPQQMDAIYTKGADILVSAAAGSGKTAVLVERIINTVTDEGRPVDIDKLLVVTFTEQAAAEMRIRLNRALNEIYKKDTSNLNIKRQISLLPHSNIMTIHAFCRKIVSENSDALELDPKFKIGEPAELLVLKQELMEELLEDEYLKENNTEFTNLVEMYAERYKDNSLRELIFEVHTFMFNSPWPFKRMEKFIEMYDMSKVNSIDETLWARLFSDAVKTRLGGALFEFNCARGVCLKENGPEKYLPILDEDINDVNLLIKALENGIEAAYSKFSGFEFTVKRIPAYKKTEPVDEELKNSAQKIRTGAKDIVKKVLSAYFAKPLSEYISELEKLRPVFKSLADITVKFAKMYQAAKADKNTLDFNDLEQFALKVLYTEDSDFENREISPYAYDTQNRFEEILTDEYQDSNYIQELILSAVSKEGNRFMVGDIKQSIYRFRQAKPEIFIEKYLKYSLLSENRNAPRVKINLFQNFRSRKNILNAINFLFFQLMSRDAGEIDYDNNAALYFGASFPEKENGADERVDIYLIETEKDDTDLTGNTPYTEPDIFQDSGYGEDESFKDEPDEAAELTKTEAEVRFIARKINEMVKPENKHCVLDKETGTYRAAKYSDIVILCPSVKSVSSVFTEEFKKHGIPLIVNSQGGYFRALEIKTVLDILHIIDNPKQDIHLIGVLHSPIYSFSSDELVSIRAVKEGGSFYGCLLEYAVSGTDAALAEKINSFLIQLYDFQETAVFTPISELLWIIYDKTNYFEYAGAMHSGNIRKANLRSLIEWALTYENTRFKGLFHFLKYVEKLQLSKTDLSEAKINSENENIVRLMTIHASKGLEFPVVFVSSLGRSFNMAERRKSIVLDADYGFGGTYTDLKYRIKHNTISRTALMQKALNEEVSERLRVLYVALTRAKEKLILTGTVTNYEKKKEKWERLLNLSTLKFPKFYMQRALNFLDWIMPAVLRRGETEGLPYEESEFSVNIVNGASVRNALDDTPPNAINLPGLDLPALTQTGLPQTGESSQESSQSALPDETEKRRIADLFAWRYPYEAAEVLPSKISISELKRLHYLEMSGSDSAPYFMEGVNFEMPVFITGAEKRKASDLGTAIHTVMEHADFFRDITQEQISNLIARLTERQLINEQDAAKIPVKKIAEFMNSDLADRARKSARLKRETPFVISVKPGEIYFEEEYKNLDESILLHGIIDLFFEENGVLILADYKSDFIANGNTDDTVKKYLPQLAVYKKALELSEALPVAEVYLHLFGAGKAVLCEV
jgi:ATP-dependent helicase/nuclease subunit A